LDEFIIMPNHLHGIIIIDNTGQGATYVTSILRAIGYGNAFAMKFGMTAWNPKFESNWTQKVGDRAKSLITKEETMAKADDAKDIKASDVTMAVIKGTTSENFVKKLLPQVKRTPVADADAGTDLVANGKVNAMLTDFPICLSVMKRYPDSGFQSVVSLLTYEPIGIALAANDPLFANLVDNFLMRAENVGVMSALSLKWFGGATITAISDK